MKVVSLFAGCGGLDLGFEKAGFNVIWANEFDDTIHETYRLNHPETILNTSDIRTLLGSNIPDCDGIIGGPPCQSWSEGGKGRGIEDPRGKLFLDYIRIVREKQPKFFVLENVKGILEDKHKHSFEDFFKQLQEAGYRVSFELLNAADYKIPQDRYRVFFVGIRNDLPNSFLFPDAVDNSFISLRQAIGDIVETPRFYCDDVVEGDHSSRMNHDVYTGPYDAKYMSRNRVRGWDEVSFAMQAQARNAPQHPQAPKMTFVTFHQREFKKGCESLYRRLSVRECARIQTFPDNFRFIYRDVKDGYKMVGNAVPPRLAWYIAMQMRKSFERENNPYHAEKELHSNNIGRLSISEIAKQYPFHIIDNLHIESNAIEGSRRVLVGLVPSSVQSAFLDNRAKMYYTGKYFPTTLQLGELYYFMPYIKGKGVKDLYIIKVARVGHRKEVVAESADNDMRIIFEIEYIRQLFDSYQPIHLNIWRTFTDTIINTILQIKKPE